MDTLTPSCDFAALKFLMLWERVEKPLHECLVGSATAHDLRGALKHFQVSRSLAGVEDDLKALAIVELLQEAGELAGASPEEKDELLTVSLARHFKCRNQSAASKVLRLRFRSPFIILDSRVATAVRIKAGISKFRSFKEYAASWRTQYSEAHPEIALACSRLPDAQRQIATWREDEASLANVVEQQWFRDRVFDIYHWEFDSGDG